MLLVVQGMRTKRNSAQRVHVPTVSPRILSKRSAHRLVVSLQPFGSCNRY